jgi:hypothetical protein
MVIATHRSESVLCWVWWAAAMNDREKGMHRMKLIFDRSWGMDIPDQAHRLEAGDWAEVPIEVSGV